MLYIVNACGSASWSFHAINVLNKGIWSNASSLGAAFFPFDHSDWLSSLTDTTVWDNVYTTVLSLCRYCVLCLDNSKGEGFNSAFSGHRKSSFRYNFRSCTNFFLEFRFNYILILCQFCFFFINRHNLHKASARKRRYDSCASRGFIIHQSRSGSTGVGSRNTG